MLCTDDDHGAGTTLMLLTLTQTLTLLMLTLMLAQMLLWTLMQTPMAALAAGRPNQKLSRAVG